MKKLLIIMLTLILLLTALCPVSAATAPSKFNVTLKSEGVKITKPMYSFGGNLHMPVMAVLKAGKVPYTYKNNTLTTKTADGKSIEIKIGSKVIKVDGKNVSMAKPAVYYSSEVYIPYRDFEKFKYTVDYFKLWNAIIVDKWVNRKDWYTQINTGRDPQVVWTNPAAWDKKNIWTPKDLGKRIAEATSMTTYNGRLPNNQAVKIRVESMIEDVQTESFMWLSDSANPVFTKDNASYDDISNRNVYDIRFYVYSRGYEEDHLKKYGGWTNENIKDLKAVISMLFPQVATEVNSNITKTLREEIWDRNIQDAFAGIDKWYPQINRTISIFKPSFSAGWGEFVCITVSPYGVRDWRNDMAIPDYPKVKLDGSNYVRDNQGYNVRRNIFKESDWSYQSKMQGTPTRLLFNNNRKSYLNSLAEQIKQYGW